MTQERVAYINGDYLPESEVKVSFRDRGFVLGDAVFDTARTFEGKIFRLDDHIDRLSGARCIAIGHRFCTDGRWWMDSCMRVFNSFD